MRIIGCDLHSRQQTLAMLNVDTGKVEESVLSHEGNKVRQYYETLPRPVRVGIEATGSMQWFLELMEELGVECLVGHPGKIRAQEPRKQKNDRRDALLLLRLLMDNRFPTIWMPSVEQRDLRALLQHRHQWVRIRVRIQNALQAIATESRLATWEQVVEPGWTRGAAGAGVAPAYPSPPQRAAGVISAPAEKNRGPGPGDG